MGCISSSAVTPIDDIVISIFGIDNAGKTCLLRSLSGNYEFDSVPTVGLGQETFMYDDIKLTVYDLGGSSKFRSVWQRFFAEIWGYIWVIDASDPQRFKENQETLEKMMENKMLKDKPFIVVANKQDIEGAIPGKDLREKINLPKNVKIIDAVVTRCNPEEKKCNEGVSEAVSSLIAEIVKNYQKIADKRVKDLEEQKQIDEREKQAKMERIAKARAEREAKAKAQEEANNNKQSEEINNNNNNKQEENNNNNANDTKNNQENN